MGLENFDIAPDNKGGRKPKDEEDVFATKETEDTPYVASDDTGEEWWKEICSEVIGKESPEGDSVGELELEVMQIADSIDTSTILVWTRLKELDMIEFEWSDYIEYCPDHTLDARVPTYGDPIVGSTSSSFSSSSNSLSEDSGLAAAINNAK